MKYETDKINPGKVFGIEIEGNGYSPEVTKAFERERGKSRVSEINIKPFTLDIPNNRGNIDIDRAMYLSDDSPAWEDIKVKVEENRVCSKMRRGDERDKLLSQEEQKQDKIKKDEEAVRWAEKRIKTDPVYQSETKWMGDKGMRKLARLYTIDHIKETGFISKEEVNVFYDLLEKAHISTVARRCRKIAELDHSRKMGIFHPAVHKNRKDDDGTARDTQIDSSKNLARKYEQGSLFGSE